MKGCPGIEDEVHVVFIFISERKEGRKRAKERRDDIYDVRFIFPVF